MSLDGLELDLGIRSDIEKVLAHLRSLLHDKFGGIQKQRECFDVKRILVVSGEVTRDDEIS